jgi:carbon starvation protein CstA
MAAIALSTMTTFLVNHGKAAYAWFTAVPASFVLVTTVSAAVLSTLNVYWPMAHNAGTETQGWVDVSLMISFVLGAGLVIASTGRRCIQTLRGVPPPSAAPPSLADGHAGPQPAAPMRCC